MKTLLETLSDNSGVPSFTRIAVVLVVFYVADKLTKMFLSMDVHDQSEELPGDERIRCSRLYPNDELMTFVYEDAQTLYECLLRGEIISENEPCLGSRKDNNEYGWMCYKDVVKRVHNFGCGLVYKGFWRGSFIGIYSQNIMEYVIAEQACYSQSMVIVPLYDTLRLHACRLIVNEAELKIVICDTESKVLTLLGDIDYMPTLTTIVVVSPVSEETICYAQKCKISLLRFQEVEEMGVMFPCSQLPPLPNNLALISYTSGTMGDPKGVMLTHGNIIANISAVGLQIGHAILTKDDIQLSFLPMAHMFERCCQMSMLMEGGKIAFFQGDIRKLSEDFTLLKPTVFPCVPRILNKMHDKIMKKVNQNYPKKLLFKIALAIRQRRLSKRTNCKDGWLDRIVFQPIRDSLGGRVRMIVVGSAPMSGSILTFFRSVLNCDIMEGYGQTECTGPCTLTIQGDNTVDHVGPPLACCHVKLIDVPSKDYFSENGEGEVCVRGPSVFTGYLNDAEKTKATLDEDGWLHTGDIGMWLLNGTLKIVDRINNIFKLAQGEYVVIEKIENIYAQCPSVLQILVYGESLKSCLIGIVVLNPDFLTKWCQKRKIMFKLASVLKNPLLKSDILNELITTGKTAGLNSFEQVKDIYLSPEEFTTENDLLTPTMKIKRKECHGYFLSEIQRMYCNLE